MSNIHIKEEEKKEFAQVRFFKVDMFEKEENYDSFADLLYHFIKFYTKNSNKTMQMIANHLGITPSDLTKKLKTDTKKEQKRPLFKDEIVKICEFLDVPFSSILFWYEYKERLNKKMKKDEFEKLMDILRGNFEKCFISQDVNKDSYIQATKCSSKKKISKNKSLRDSLATESITGKWYFYIPSSDSAIIKKQKKKLRKDSIPKPSDPDILELFNLYTPDHIYCGTLNITREEDEYHSCLKYMTNPSTYNVLQYDGTISYPTDKHAIFSALTNQIESETIYLIIDTLSVEQDFNYVMASVLLMSRHKKEDHQRPCSMRMILSREQIEFDSCAYKVMISNLMMNDSIIRIDKNGYEELKKYQKEYNSPALDIFLQKYPTIEKLAEDEHFFTVNKCAYIKEQYFKVFQINDLSEKDMLYLEALLRRHSIASWYSKSKASKINDVLMTINENLE